MRKLSLLLVSAMMVFSLAACGNDTTDKEPQVQVGNNAAETTTAAENSNSRNLDSLSSEAKGSWYSDYIKALMECKYYGELSGYQTEVANATKDDAQECHDGTVEYYAYELMQYTDVGYDYVSEETVNQWVDVAREIMAKTKFTVNEGTLVGDDYQVKVDIQPLNINDLIYDEVGAYIEEYNSMLNGVDTSAYTDEQWDALEEEYAAGVLTIIKNHIPEIGYKDTVSKIVIITFDEEGRYGISDEDWYDIDDYVVDMK